MMSTSYVLTDNLIVNGTAGGLDRRHRPQCCHSSLGPNVGETLLPGVYNCKVTYVDRSWLRKCPIDASTGINLTAGQTAVSVAGLLRRPAAIVNGNCIAARWKVPAQFGCQARSNDVDLLDIGQVAGGTLPDRRGIGGVTTTVPLTTGSLASGTHSYRVVMVDAGGREGLASSPTAAMDLTAAGSIQLANLAADACGLYQSPNLSQ
ncbi:MAG: hypothetical protein R3C56_21625 [Pirellulaceae bacterium]